MEDIRSYDTNTPAPGGDCPALGGKGDTTEHIPGDEPLFEGGGIQDDSVDSSTSLSLISEITKIPEVDITLRRKGLREPWKKGESGNPGGRPKKAQSITDQLTQEASRVVTVTVGGVKYRGRNMEILAKRMFERGIRKVEPRLVAEIIDRVDGRAVSMMELVGRDGEPIRITVAYDGNIKS